MDKFNFAKRIKSFVYAWRGIVVLISHEHNAWIHSFAAIVVVIAGLLLELNRMDWVAVTGCIAAVFAAEAFNTAIEKLVDIVSPQHNPKAGMVKDIAAGAVLITAIGAATIGFIIFVPHIISAIH